MVTDSIPTWHALVEREGHELCSALASRMRQRRLTFGDRLLCPFLRPFFLGPDDEVRVARAAETLWILGERIAQAALEDRSLLEEVDGKRQHGIAHYLDLVQQGRVDVSAMLTHTFPLDRWRDAFATLARQGDTGAIKVAIDQR